MKKIINVVFLSIIMILTLSLTCFAVNDEEFIEEQYEASGANELIRELPKETREMLESLGVKKVEFDNINEISFRRLVELIVNLAKGNLENPLKFMTVMIGVFILISVVRTLVPQEDNKALDLACSLFIIIASIGSMISYVPYMISAIDASNKFLISFVPVYTALIAASGNPTSAFTYNTAALGIAEVSSSLINVFLVPLIVMLIALSISASISPALNMSGLVGMFKKTIMWVLTATTTIFTGFISLKGIMVSSADTMAVKSGQALMGTLVPIIGSSLSDAYSSILGSMSMLKNAVGIFGIVSILLINIPVLVQIGLWILSIAISSYVAEALGQNKGSQLLSNINATNIILVAILMFNLILILVSSAIVMMFKANL